MSDPVGPYLPTNGLVVMSWLGQRVTGIVPAQVAGSLPDDRTKWVDEGFVQVTEIPGARADIDLPQARKPIVQVDFWACNIAGAKPPWHKAARLVELLRSAVEVQPYGAPLVLPAGYLGARVQAAYFLDEPSAVRDDPSGYARFTADLAVDWVRA
jgi:hypothetical protein